jgi:Peptidase family S41
MIFRRQCFPFLAALLFAAVNLLAADAPPFAEVFELVRTNLTGLDAAALNQLAVEGFVQRLGGRAQFADAPLASEPPADLLPAATIYDGHYAYVRLGEVSGGVAARLDAAIKRLAATNQVNGLVLDLRFAGGRDFATAARVADLFLTTNQPVLDWGEGTFVATTKTNGFTLPLAVLVNHQTRGGAEAVAAVLRRAGVALLIGGTTAGEASRYREFTLSNGQRLRLAVIPVKLGDGEALPPAGVVPDIAVNIRAEAERAYLADPFGIVSSATTAPSGTNQIAAAARPRRKLTEADLVRARQENRPLDAPTNLPVAAVEPPKVVRDPALARALDLLKGLSVIRAR